MDRDAIVRRALWLSVPFNLLGALLFAFPGSWAGQLAGLPADVPSLYRALVVLFVVLFGAAYGWLAAASTIHRPMVALAAVGKIAAFAVVLSLCLVGEAPLRALLGMTGDLVLGGIFAWWLLSAPRH